MLLPRGNVALTIRVANGFSFPSIRSFSKSSYPVYGSRTRNHNE